MCDPFARKYSCRYGPRTEYERIVRAPFRIGSGHTNRSSPMKPFTVICVHQAERGLAEPHCLFEHRVEHRREVAGGGIDDPQNLGGCGLLVERLARLSDETRILDS